MVTLTLICECPLTKGLASLLFKFCQSTSTNRQRYGFIVSESGEEFFIHEKFLSPNIEELKKDVVVTFSVLPKSKSSDKHDKAKDIKLLVEENDDTMLAYCFHCQDPSFWRPIAKKYILTKPVEIALELTLKKIQMLDIKNRRLLILELLELAEAPQAIFFRENCDDDTKLNIFSKILCKDLIQNNIPLQEELQAFLKSAEKQIKDKFWKNTNAQRSVTYKGFLWDLAPLWLKELFLRREYPLFFEILDKFYETFYIYPSEDLVSTNASDLYSSLTSKDYELARRWEQAENSSNKDYVRAKMLSARAAEKCVKKFYESLGYAVIDTAIQQLDLSSNDWIKCDLLVNSSIDKTISLDVKNTRSSVSFKERYSEFCVPKFKETRGNEVIIAGVFSPYLKIEDIQNPSNIRDFVRFLGVTQNSEIEWLQREFSSQFLRLTIHRESINNRKPISNYLPPWLFDYSKAFYTNQIQAVERFRHSINRLQPQDLPDWQDILDITNPLPAYLASQVEVPEKWMQELEFWEKSFLQQLMRSERRISLPFLYLSIFAHFIDMLKNNIINYDPQRCAKLLKPVSTRLKSSLLEASDSCSLKINSVSNSSSWNKNVTYPLGVYDPLELISDLYNTLTCLWNNRLSQALTEFRIFEFNGKGLLKGQITNNAPRMTILAYCGGEKRDERGKYMGKCGFPTLIIGRETSCEKCHKLICSKCNYCSDDCIDNYRDRLRNRIRNTSNLPACFYRKSYINLSDEIPF